MVKKFDDMAWESIRNRRPSNREHKGLDRSGRPKNFAELEQMIRSGTEAQIAFLEFLDEFYLFKEPEFFTKEPSTYFTNETRVFLAGVVEFLGQRLGVAVPNWVGQPEYFLAEPLKMSHDDTGEPEFKRRNILYNPRHLLRL